MFRSTCTNPPHARDTPWQGADCTFVSKPVTRNRVYKRPYSFNQKPRFQFLHHTASLWFNRISIFYCISYHTLGSLSSKIFILSHLFFHVQEYQAGDANAASPNPWAVRGEQPPRNVEAWNTLFSFVTFQCVRENTICHIISAEVFQRQKAFCLGRPF